MAKVGSVCSILSGILFLASGIVGDGRIIVPHTRWVPE
jgi:hypothetical protein